MTMFCTACHATGKPKRTTKGSFLIELALWACFLLPGLAYSVWRLTTKADVCRSCGHAGLIPPGSPRAQEHRA